MCARIVCTPRDKDGNIRGYSGKNEKPPSLAGVEKFIRAKIAAAAAAAVPSVSALPPKVPPPGDPLAPTTAEVGGVASKTKPAPVQTAETVQDPVASPSQKEAKETKQTATDAPQLPPDDTVLTAREEV
jgi:hypothetical protein